MNVDSRAPARMAAVVLCAVAAALAVTAAPAAATRISSVTNGQIEVGVDLDRGGSLTLLRYAGQSNLVNHHDLGREVQQSYYAFPVPFGKPDAAWATLGWNPVAAGDNHGNPSRVLSTSKTGNSISVVSRPKQWPLNNVDCECTFQETLTLAGHVVHVRDRLINARSDHTFYAARDQELPAAYTVGFLDHLWTYSGDHPFTGAPAQSRERVWPPQVFDATEHWVAFIDNDGPNGVGVVNPAITRFQAGYLDAGMRVGTGREADNQTGYITPQFQEHLDHNIVYDNAYDLVLGSVADIRADARAIAVDERPDYTFAADRQHVTYTNAVDDGWPIRGAIDVHADRPDPQVVFPRRIYDAPAAPRLYVRMAISGTTQDLAELFFSRVGQTFNAERRLPFGVIPDGQPHTYAIDMNGNGQYIGRIAQLRLDPLVGGVAGSRAAISYVGIHDPTPGVAPVVAPRGRAASFKLLAKARRQRAGRRLELRVRCSARCKVRARVRAGRGRAARSVRSGRKTIRAHRWTRLRVTLSRRVRARIRHDLRRHRSTRVSVLVAGRAGHTVRTKRFRVTLRRR